MLAHEPFPVLGLGPLARTLTSWSWNKTSGELLAEHGSDIDLSVIKSLDYSRQDPSLVLATGSGHDLYAVNWRVQVVRTVPLPGTGNSNPRFVRDLSNNVTLVMLELPGSLRRLLWATPIASDDAQISVLQSWLVRPGELQTTVINRYTSCFQRSVGVVECYQFAPQEVLPELPMGGDTPIDWIAVGLAHVAHHRAPNALPCLHVGIR